MVIKLNKKNPIAKDLFTKKYKPKIVKPKKEKEVLKERKVRLKVSHQFVVLLLMTFQYLSSRHSFVDNLLIYPCRNPAANKSPAPVRSKIFKIFIVYHTQKLLYLNCNCTFFTSCYNY